MCSIFSVTLKRNNTNRWDFYWLIKYKRVRGNIIASALFQHKATTYFFENASRTLQPFVVTFLKISFQIADMQKSWFRVNLCIYAVLLLWSFAFASDDPLCFQVTQTNCTDSLKNGQKCTKISQDTSTSQMYCCNITTEAEIRDYIMKLRIGKNCSKIAPGYLVQKRRRG